MNVQVFWENGNYDSFSGPPMVFGEGYLIDNQQFVMEDFKDKGLRFERSFWATPDEDEEGEGFRVCDARLIVSPEELERVELVVVDGIAFLGRDENGILVDIRHQESEASQSATVDEEQETGEAAEEDGEQDADFDETGG